MDLRIAARMFAVLALVAAMVVAAMALRGNGPEDASALGGFRDPGGEPVRRSPVEAELLRCRDIGMAALNDASCREAWAENRRRFFGNDRPAAAAPERFDRPSPQTPDWPLHVPDLNNAGRQ